MAELEKKGALRRWFGKDRAGEEAPPPVATAPAPGSAPAPEAAVIPTATTISSEPPPRASPPEPEPRPTAASNFVRSTGEIPRHADTNVPLHIRFLDPIQGIKIGKDFRFEVAEADAGRGEHKVAIDRLDFSFAPLAWGEVRPGADATTGIVRVVAVHRPADIYDRPKYDMVATVKSHGGAVVETVVRFALAIGLPVVELLFFLKNGDEEFEPFRPQEQRTSLDARRDFEVEPRDAGEVFVERDRIFFRFLRSDVRPRVTARFPNEETATLEVDLRHAGRGPVVEEEAEAPEELLAPPPEPAVEARASTPLPPAEVLKEGDDAPAAIVGVADSPRYGLSFEVEAQGRAASQSPEPKGEFLQSQSPTPPLPARPPVDPSAGLRAELARLRADADRARAANALADEGPRLARKAEFLKNAVKSYVGPDVERLRDALAATLRETGLQ